MIDANQKRWTQRVHTWVGLGGAVFVLLLVITGVLLNHPGAIHGAASQPLCLAADPLTPGRIYRGTWSSLDRSEDGGKTWDEVPMLFPAEEVVSVSFHPADPRTVYALQRWEGPLRSTDGGVVWERVPLDFDPAEAGVELIALTASPKGALLLQTTAGLLRLDPGSAKWTPLDFDLHRQNWLRVVRSLHNGRFFGQWFVKLYDATGAGLVLLILTGILLWRLRATQF